MMKKNKFFIGTLTKAERKKRLPEYEALFPDYEIIYETSVYSLKNFEQMLKSTQENELIVFLNVLKLGKNAYEINAKIKAIQDRNARLFLYEEQMYIEPDNQWITSIVKNLTRVPLVKQKKYTDTQIIQALKLKKKMKLTFPEIADLSGIAIIELQKYSRLHKLGRKQPNKKKNPA